MQQRKHKQKAFPFPSLPLHAPSHPSSPLNGKVNTGKKSFQCFPQRQRMLVENLMLVVTSQLERYSSSETVLCCQEVRGISTPFTIFQRPISQFGISRSWGPFIFSFSSLPFGHLPCFIKRGKTQICPFGSLLEAVMEASLGTAIEAIEGRCGDYPWIRII